MNPWSLTNMWFTNWRMYVRSAKLHPTNDMYQRLAVITNGNYVMSLAVELAEANRAKKN